MMLRVTDAVRGSAIIDVHADGTVAARSGAPYSTHALRHWARATNSDLQIVTYNVDNPTPAYGHPAALLGSRVTGAVAGVPHTMAALGLRRVLLSGDRAVSTKDDLVDSFATTVLGRRGARWREAVSTALLSDWADPFFGGETLGPAALDRLKAEAERVHCQLLPLWRRRTRGSGLLLLDTPLGDGLCLYDLLASRPGQQTLTGTEPDDARLATLLRALRPDERAVALGWAHPGVTTWAEAAWLAGATDPATTGERVRRKVQRLAAEQQRRRAQQQTAQRTTRPA
nr:hypothetical protein OG546_36530 [Streptomyces antimycoticus]